jgi:hypothetical protein
MTKLAQLITALSRLGGEPGIAEQQAHRIFPLMIAVVAPTRGYDIGGDGEDFYARPLSHTAGLARELRDLGGKARKAAAGKLSKEAWMKAWAAVPHRTQRLLWRPKLIRMERGHAIDRNTLSGSYSAPGLQTIAPKPEVVLPTIAAEAERLKKTPSAQRPKRVRDGNERAAIEAIRNAYRAVTGYRGGRAIGADGRLTGRLHRLGRDIDVIFGTQLFAEKDSRRLRRVGEKRPY